VTDNFSFLNSHIVVRSDVKQLGSIPTQRHSEEEEEEDEDLEDSMSQTQGDIQHHSTESDDRPGPSSRPPSSLSGKPAPKAKVSRKRRQLDDAILKLVEKASGTQKMQEQVDAAILSSNNSRTT
jgi:hypothetical protein